MNVILFNNVVDTAALSMLLHRPLAMDEVVIFLTCVLLTACRSLSTEVTSNSGINERGTTTVLQTNAPVLTDDNSTFTDEVKWTKLTTDAKTNERPLHSNVTANEDRDKAGIKMNIRYVSFVVLPILITIGICGNIVTIRVILAKEFRSIPIHVRQRLPDRPGSVRYRCHLYVNSQQASGSQPNGGRRST